MTKKEYIYAGVFSFILLFVIIILMRYTTLGILGKQNSSAQVEKQRIEILSQQWWNFKKINGKEIVYKMENDFSQCPVAKNVKENGANGKVIAPLAHTSRLYFFETLLKNHCINYEETDISEVAFDDIAQNDIKTKQIAQTAINLGIAQWYEIWWRKVFRASKKVAKIEALAVLIKISGIQIKNTEVVYNFADVEENWKQWVADISHRLQLTPIDAKENLFFPDYIMKKSDTYDLIAKMVTFY